MKKNRDGLCQSPNEIIFDFEEKYDPFKYKIEGFCIWPILRFAIYENLKINTYNYLPRFSRSIKKSQIIRHIVLNLPKEIWKLLNLRRKNKDFIIVTFYDSLKDMENGHYINIYFDYFKDLSGRAIYWYNDITGDRLKNYHSDYIDGYIVLLARVIYGEYRVKFYLDYINGLYSDFKHYLKENNVEKNFTLDVKKWYRLIRYFLSSKLIFSLFIKVIRPKLIFIENSYGQEGFIAAAKKCDIPIFEVQHGLIGRGHVGYAYGGIALKYKKNVPLPNKIITFGKYFSELLQEKEFWGPEDVPAVGFPRLEYFIKKLKNSHRKDSQLSLLISSQWTVIDKIIAFLRPIIDLIDKDVLITIKPHPLESAEQTDRYKELGRVIKILDKNIELYQALTNSDIHCGVHSTTLFESVAFGIPTIILNIPGCEEVYTLVENGSAKLASSPDELCNILNSVVSDKIFYSEWKRTTVINRGYFFESDPDQKLEQLLSSVLY